MVYKFVEAMEIKKNGWEKKRAREVEGGIIPHLLEKDREEKNCRQRTDSSVFDCCTLPPSPTEPFAILRSQNMSITVSQL